MSLKKILFASDLSERAARAGRRAVQLATDAGAELEALHVVEGVFPSAARLGGGGGEPADLVRRAAEDELQESTPDFVAGVRVVFGNVVGELVRAADKDGVDLVTIGAHGRQFIKDWLVGTTAEQLVRHTQAPTLVVRNDPAGPYRRIVVATDFSECAGAALARAADWFGTGPLQVVHVLDTGPLERMRSAGVDELLVEKYYGELSDEAGEQLRAFVEQAGIALDDGQLEVRAGYPADTLHQAVDQLKPDLVVLGNHGRGRWGGLLLGSVATRLLHELDTDVLLVRSD